MHVNGALLVYILLFIGQCLLGDFSQDRQGRLVHVRTVVTVTCIKI